MNGILLRRDRLLGLLKGSRGAWGACAARKRSERRPYRADPQSEGIALTVTGAEGVRWDLTRLYQSPDAPEIEGDLSLALEEAKAFAGRYRARVGTLGAADLAGAVAELELIQERVQKVGTFAFLHFCTDTGD